MTLQVVGATIKDYLDLLSDHGFIHLRYLKLIVMEQAILIDLINLAKVKKALEIHIEVSVFLNLNKDENGNYKSI